MTDKCKSCGRELTSDEIGATKRFINRGATEFYCLDCIAARFKVTRTYLKEKIEFLRNSGCTLFPK